jgi:hypothetical protein
LSLPTTGMNGYMMPAARLVRPRVYLPVATSRFSPGDIRPQADAEKRMADPSLDIKDWYLSLKDLPKR